jgi:DNA-directed RNA polymerase sigma subunit (sigma70/sigma32)
MVHLWVMPLSAPAPTVATRAVAHVGEQVGRLRRTEARLQELLGREPATGELAGALRWPVERVAQLQRAGHTA